jgi:hypothetical protein
MSVTESLTVLKRELLFVPQLLERLERETERLYPHRNLVAGEIFFALAA